MSTSCRFGCRLNIHRFIFDCVGLLEPNPPAGVVGQRQGDFLDKSPVHHRAVDYTFLIFHPTYHLTPVQKSGTSAALCIFCWRLDQSCCSSRSVPGFAGQHICPPPLPIAPSQSYPSFAMSTTLPPFSWCGPERRRGTESETEGKQKFVCTTNAGTNRAAGEVRWGGGPLFTAIGAPWWNQRARHLGAGERFECGTATTARSGSASALCSCGAQVSVLLSVLFQTSLHIPASGAAAADKGQERPSR